MSSSTENCHGTVLLVSDYAPALHNALERYACVVHTVTAHEFIIDQIGSLQPDLVLFRVTSLTSQGVKLCRNIKAFINTQADDAFLPVMLIIPAGESSHPQVERLYDGMLDASGADEVLLEPLQDNTIRRRLLPMIDLKRRFDVLRAQNWDLKTQLANHDRKLQDALAGARELSILKDSIVNNVSHELRTPLLQVKSAVAMLDAEARNNPNLNGVTRLLEYATQSTSRLESVIQNITQLATSLNLKTEPFRVIDAVNLAIRQLGRSWSSSRDVNRIKVKVSAELPFVLGDKNGIAQVLFQLIDNALKFSPSGDPVEVRAATVKGKGKIQGVRLAVRDYGIGIDANQVERIFQEFYQIDHDSTRRFGGLGAGLAIVKLILDKMGLTVKVESRPNVGSTFSLVLPLAP